MALSTAEQKHLAKALANAEIYLQFSPRKEGSVLFLQALFLLLFQNRNGNECRNTSLLLYVLYPKEKKKETKKKTITQIYAEPLETEFMAPLFLGEKKLNEKALTKRGERIIIPARFFHLQGLRVPMRVSLWF